VTPIRSLLVSALIFGVVAFSGTSAHAAGCSDSWTKPTSGDWGVAANWTNGIPTGTDAVCITVSGTYTVTLAPWSIGTADPNNNGANVASITVGAASETGTQTLDVVGQGSTSNSNEQISTVSLNTTGSDTSTITTHGVLVLDSTNGGSTLPGNPSGGFAEVGGGPFLNYGKIESEIQDPKNKLANYTDFEAPLTNEARASVTDDSGLLEVSNVTNDAAFTIASRASMSVIPPVFASPASFTNNGSFVNNGTVTGSTGATWTQSGGSVKGHAVTLQGGAKLVDHAGAGQFLMNYAGATLTGTIPVGQTVTVVGEPSSSQGNNYNGTTLGLGGTTVVNNGTLVLDAQGSGSKSGGPAIVNDGGIRNNGTIDAAVTDTSWNVQFQGGLDNTHSGRIVVTGGAFADSGGGSVINDGTVTVGPGAAYVLSAASSFKNTSHGAIVLQIAGATRLGQFQLTAPCCAGPGALTAGGSLLPRLVHRYVPKPNLEFQLVLLSGGKFSGTFKTVASKFTADYTKETASPPFVGAIYDKSATKPKK
jgi:hypothetical protein